MFDFRPKHPKHVDPPKEIRLQHRHPELSYTGTRETARCRSGCVLSSTARRRNARCSSAKAGQAGGEEGERETGESSES